MGLVEPDGVLIEIGDKIFSIETEGKIGVCMSTPVPIKHTACPDLIRTACSTVIGQVSSCSAMQKTGVINYICYTFSHV